MWVRAARAHAQTTSSRPSAGICGSAKYPLRSVLRSLAHFYAARTSLWGNNARTSLRVFRPALIGLVAVLLAMSGTALPRHRPPTVAAAAVQGDARACRGPTALGTQPLKFAAIAAATTSATPTGPAPNAARSATGCSTRSTAPGAVADEHATAGLASTTATAPIRMTTWTFKDWACARRTGQRPQPRRQRAGHRGQAASTPRASTALPEEALAPGAQPARTLRRHRPDSFARECRGSCRGRWGTRTRSTSCSTTSAARHRAQHRRADLDEPDTVRATRASGTRPR